MPSTRSSEQNPGTSSVMLSKSIMVRLRRSAAQISVATSFHCGAVEVDRVVQGTNDLSGFVVVTAAIGERGPFQADAHERDGP